MTEFGRVPDCIEINGLDDSPSSKGKSAHKLNKGNLVRGPDVTVDSGAATSVANPADYPGAKVTPSLASKAGQRFVGPGGDKIKNEGQFSPQALLESGAIGKFNYAVAKIRKPFCAVSDLNGKGNPCWFDGELSNILPSNCPQLPEIRRLIAEATDKIPMHLEQGTYKIHTWVPPAGPFQGQGW